MSTSFHPPATRRQYDVCVVGSQVGGAIAASLLAKRGFRVLEIDHDGRGAGYVDGGWVLPWRPALFPSPRLMPAGESALNELGAASALARALRHVPSGVQLLLPRHRLDLPSTPEPLAAELRREWPGEDSALDAALREVDALFEDAGRFLASAPPLPPRGFFARLALKRAIARAAGPKRRSLQDARPFESLGEHPLPAALLALYPFLASLDAPPPPLALARVLGGALRGLHVADGGSSALRELFRRHDGRAGAADHELAAAERGVVEAIELSGSRLQGARLAGSSDLHAARVFLLATDSSAFARLLPRGAARAAASLGRLEPSRRILTVNLVVKEEALPPPLGPAALVLLGGDPVLVEVQAARRQSPDEAAPSGGDHVLCAAAAVPAEPWTRETVRAAADRIRAALTKAFPFFDRHVVFESIPTLVGAGEGEPFPEAADPLYAPPADAALGVTGLPIRGPFRNLFLASRDVLPGLGLEGEIFAGIEAAAHASASLGKKDRP